MEFPKVAPPPEKTGKDFLTGTVGNQDKMSPYRTPSSHSVYHDLSEVINHKPFNAWYPQSYTPVPSYFKDHGFTPYFNPKEEDDYAYGALTIAGMIELTSLNSSWRLDRDQDIEVVIGIVEQYSEVLKVHASSSYHQAYLQRIEYFLRKMYEVRDRLYHRTGRANPYRVDIVEVIKSLLRK